MTNAPLSADNKIVNGLWISPDGAPLSNLERLCIYSFCANGHDFRLWTCGDLPNVPRISDKGGQVEVRDAAEILPKSKIFSYHGGSFAGFADWFRWELMRKIGGWYADMDVVALRPFAFDGGRVICKETIDTVNSAVMKFPKGDYVAEKMADACARPNLKTPWDTKKRAKRKFMRRLKFWHNGRSKQGWGESGGPAGFTLAAKHFGIFQNARPVSEFMFVPWHASEWFVSDELYRMGILAPLLQNGFAMHFYGYALKNAGIDSNAEFHPDSPFEILKRRYLPELRE